MNLNSISEPEKLKHIFIKLFRVKNSMSFSENIIKNLKVDKKILLVSGHRSLFFPDTNPYEEGMRGVVESLRKLICTGAEPAGALYSVKEEKVSCFPEWEKGVKKALNYFRVPLFNENLYSFISESTFRERCFFSSIIFIIGVLREDESPLPDYFHGNNQILLLVGYPGEEISGSLYNYYFHKSGGCPHVELEEEKRLFSALRHLIRKRLITSARSVSLGGLAIAIGEGLICNPEGPLGGEFKIDTYLSKVASFFGESQCRTVVSTGEELAYEVMKEVRKFHIPARYLGRVEKKGLIFDGSFTISPRGLLALWKNFRVRKTPSL